MRAPKKLSGWTCPKCGRAFGRKPGGHSCVACSLDDHFQGKPPLLRKVFRSLVRKPRKSGPVRVDAVRTAIHLGRSATSRWWSSGRAGFGWSSS